MAREKLEFKLAGRGHTLDSEEVEDAVKHAEPGPIDKYFVEMHGSRYPLKQVLSLALRIPPGDFISTDARRILKKLGFKIRTLDQVHTATKTESEELFQAYLGMRGLTNYSFEPDLPETSQRPDYALDFQKTQIFFEIKEFSATPEDFRPGFRQFDPYEPIREKIEAGRRKFRDLKDYCCCLVLYNRKKPFVNLGWQFIYGALLGNLAIRIPLYDSHKVGPEQTETGFFGGKGKGIRYSKENPTKPIGLQNQTISAIVVLEQMPLGKRRFDIALAKLQGDMGRRVTLEEHLYLIEKSQGTEQDVSLSQLRLVVCENPYARIRLPRGIFYGPYDELYGLDDETGGSIVRIYVGDHAKQLESQEEQSKSQSQHTFEGYLNEKARK